MCQLDNEIFTCHRCGGEFDQTKGTWLPVGETDSRFMREVGGYASSLGSNRFFAWDLREPEVITSDDFTCYDCLKVND